MSKRIKLLSALLIIFTVCCASSFYACSKSGVLNAPQDLKIENDILFWKEVDSANGYLVTINGKDYQTDDNQLDIFEITKNYEDYTITVTALGDYSETYDSNRSSAINYTVCYPTGLTFEENAQGTAYKIQSADTESLSEKLVIPSVINGKPITEIADNAFKECNNIITVIIPDTITDIGQYAFKECARLTRVKLSDEIDAIKNGCFDGCKNLKDVILPYFLNEIQINAFANCESLTEINFPTNLSKINGNAFAGCNSLTQVYIPKNVTTLGSAFSSCENLSKVIVDEDNKTYKCDGNCILKQGGTDVLYGFGSNCTIPDYATAINDYCFSYNTALTSIKVPSSIEKIGKNAFSYCKNLASIELNVGLKKIGIPNISAPNQIFFGCEKLKSINIPSSVEYITGDLASGADNLEIITVDKDNKYYKSSNNTIISKNYNEVVAGCKTSVIPEYVESIGEYAFSNSPIEEITLPQNLIKIKKSAFSDAKLKLVKIPDSVTVIEETAFACCEDLTEALLSNTLTEIGAGAFYFCTSLSYIAIPKSVKTIGERAFYHNDYSFSITLPREVETIGTGAFWTATVYTDAEKDNENWYYTEAYPPIEGISYTWYEDSHVYYGCVFDYENNTPYISRFTKTCKNYTEGAASIPYRHGYEFAGWDTAETATNVIVEKKLITFKIAFTNFTVTYMATFDLQEDAYVNLPYGTYLYAVWTKVSTED